MKKSVDLPITVLFLFCLLINPQKLFPQIQFFDSVKTFEYSSIYDYKNPVFENQYTEIMISSRISYERHLGNNSDILMGVFDYNNSYGGYVITDSGTGKNINPSFSGNLLVWQSNRSGNWDIYYSRFLSELFWTDPVLLDSSSSDETEPCVLNNYNYLNYYYLTYKKGNDICFRRFNKSTLQWDIDTVLTGEISEDCYSPVLNYSAGNFGLIFLRIYPGGISRINIKPFTQSASGVITWYPTVQNNQSYSQTNLRTSFSLLEILTYDYDTLGSRHSMGFGFNNSESREVFTKTIPGNNSSGKGTYMPLITESMTYYFSVFGCITRSSDSTRLTLLNRPASFNTNPYYKSIYIGNSSASVKFDISPPVSQITGYYKIWAVWEKIINGRSALAVSMMYDFLGNISSSGENAKNFFLYQNYPNPFNPETNISYKLQSDGFVSLKIYDILGKETAALVNKDQEAGYYTVRFAGNGYSGGVYYYRIEFKPVNGNYRRYSESKKMLLLK